MPSNQTVVEELRWKKFPVLSDGFVTLVDVMGDDQSVVQAARVSYGKDERLWDCDEMGGPPSPHESAEKIETDLQNHYNEKDRSLLRYLMRHRHSTPFEMAEVKILVRVPMDCWRQWIRHRTANVNEYSTRYTEAIDSMDQTKIDEWRLQSGGNKQGSSGNLEMWPDGYEVLPIAEDGDLLLPGVVTKKNEDSHVGWAVVRHSESQTDIMIPYPGRKLKEITPGLYLSDVEFQDHEDSKQIYRERLKFGVAREQARKDLPLSNYTIAYWKCDLHNILGFLALRMDSHAQKEIRDYATIIGEQIIKPLFPMVWESFVHYRLEALTLTSLDVKVVCGILKGEDYHKLLNEVFDNKRERSECLEKMKRLSMAFE